MLLLVFLGNVLQYVCYNIFQPPPNFHHVHLLLSSCCECVYNMTCAHFFTRKRVVMFFVTARCARVRCNAASTFLIAQVHTDVPHHQYSSVNQQQQLYQ